MFRYTGYILYICDIGIPIGIPISFSISIPISISRNFVKFKKLIREEWGKTLRKSVVYKKSYTIFTILDIH